MRVRLTNDFASGPTYEGRVEVSLDSGNSWGTVCSNGFDNRDANVICRQLGLPTASEL